MQKRIILVMKKYIIEPLGVMHLAGIAKELGLDVRIFLHEDFNFQPLFEEIESFKPDWVGFSTWTGAHLQTFRAADIIRKMGVKVAIGGPHATYFSEECAGHADAVAKGESFRILRQILTGVSLPGIVEASPRIFFDTQPRVEDFPLPSAGRDIVYHRYPDLGASPIKSIMGSTGCPFHCSYCNSPHLNEMYGGFEKVFRVRPIDDIIREAVHVRDEWGAEMFYFQDDIFGYRIDWLTEFSRRWKKEVGIPWHCQIRLELIKGDVGLRRLELFREGLCSGITLAIESGDDFLREFVLLRPMPHELIVEGCKKIMDFGLTLRTEQILQIPFSNLKTDLSTLKLNCEICPQMSWSSILAPFGETNMGKIAHNFGFYTGNNDDLDEVFYFDYSQLRHSETAKSVIEPIARKISEEKKTQRFESPLLKMFAKPGENESLVSDVYYRDESLIGIKPESLCKIQFMNDEENTRYCDQTSRLQRLFNWLSKVPQGWKLGEKWTSLPKEDWTFAKLGELTEAHLKECGYGERAEKWKIEFAARLGCSADNLPPGIRDNPLYFCFFPSSDEFAKRIQEKKIFDLDSWKFFNALGGEARRWLFSRFVYKTDAATPPIAKA